MEKIRIKHDGEQWEAEVRRITKAEKCYQIRIESRSGITMIIGQYTSGWFACFPDYGIGAGLSANLSDKFYNIEALKRVGLPEVDAVTVAEVLAKLEKDMNL